MSTSDDGEDQEAQRRRAVLHGAPQPSPRQAVPGELLCEFYSEKRRKFYRIELRDRGQYGVEAQLLDPVEMLYGQLFPARELAIAWAEEQRRRSRRANYERQHTSAVQGVVVADP